MSYKPQTDLSLLSVLFGNVLSIVMAFIYDWSLGQIMWIYWGQSITIGVMNVIRMLSLREFTTAGLRMNEQPVPETPKAKHQIAGFFAIHYGLFHVGYAVFLWQEMPLDTISMDNMMLMMVCVSVFVGSHAFSLLHNMADDFREKKPNLGTLMFYPYLRIIPMHLTIIFGGMLGHGSLTMALFMGLKTLADLGMHMIEHHLFQKDHQTISNDDYNQD